MYKSILILSVALVAVLAKNEEYDGHSLYQVTVSGPEQTQVLAQLENTLNIDVWSLAIPSTPGQILVPSHLKQQFQDALNAADIKYEVLVQNIKQSLDLEEELLSEAASKAAGKRSTVGGLNFDEIHRYAVVDSYLVDLASRFPNLVRVASAGRSVEGRDIKYLRISTTDFNDSSKPVVYMQSLLHCREWVTLPAVLYAIQKLVLEGAEPELLQRIDWVIMPIANPDGYEFTHTSSRFWRKNRATGYSIWCPGVDLNRNFDASWGSASSSSACSDTFHGSGPFSEPESQAVRSVVTQFASRMRLYLDIHSFGSMILYGFGNGTLAPNALTMHVGGVNMAQAIDRVKWPQNNNYIVGNIFSILYAASGGSSDWAQIAGADYSYTYELPAYRNNHNNLNGFLVEPDFIEQAGYETWEGIKAGAQFILGY